MKHRALLPFLALILALLCCLPACTAATDSAQDTTDEVTTTPTPAQTEPPLTITENGVSTFTLIRPEEAGSIITSSATALRHKLIERTGAELALASDWYNPREEKPTFDNPEILLGETNRDESTEVLASLPENSYAVVKRNNKLVIIGTDDNLTILALYAFEEQILNNAEKCADGTLTFSEADNLLVTLDAFTLSDMIKSGYAITASSTKVVSSAKQGEYGVGQGACSDGTYAYFALRNSTDTGTVITKYALESNTLVKVSDVLNLGHANDMTYDAKNDRIVVAHGQSEGQILTLVDPDTLEAIEDIHIPKGSGAITYSVEKDRYAISQGGKTLYILSDKFELLASYSRTQNASYTAQGMGSDEDYIFFPMSGSSDNILEVYDWSGSYITTITVPMKIESESMYWVNNRYYIAYNSAGAVLYETTFGILFE